MVHVYCALYAVAAGCFTLAIVWPRALDRRLGFLAAGLVAWVLVPLLRVATGA